MNFWCGRCYLKRNYFIQKIIQESKFTKSKLMTDVRCCNGFCSKFPLNYISTVIPYLYFEDKITSFFLREKQFLIWKTIVDQVYMYLYNFYVMEFHHYMYAMEWKLIKIENVTFPLTVVIYTLKTEIISAPRLIGDIWGAICRQASQRNFFHW